MLLGDDDQGESILVNLTNETGLETNNIINNEP